MGQFILFWSNFNITWRHNTELNRYVITKNVCVFIEFNMLLCIIQNDWDQRTDIFKFVNQKLFCLKHWFDSLSGYLQVYWIQFSFIPWSFILFLNPCTEWNTLCIFFTTLFPWMILRLLNLVKSGNELKI